MNDLFREAFSNRRRMTLNETAGELERLADGLGRINRSSDAFLDEIEEAALLRDLELSLLHLYLQVCYAENLMTFPDPDGGPEEGRTVPDSLPCVVHYSKRYRALLVDTPAIIASTRNTDHGMQSNLLKSLVVMAVKKYESDCGLCLSRLIGTPFSFCLYRRCLKDQSSVSVPDIDNIEAQKIINALARELGLCDSYDGMISSVNSIEYVAKNGWLGTSILIVEEGKRNDLERQFLLQDRSFDRILRI